MKPTKKPQTAEPVETAPSFIPLWNYGTKLWLVDRNDFTICPVKVVDVSLSPSAKREKRFEPLYSLVWSDLLWAGPDHTFYWDREFLFERTPEGTQAAIQLLRKLIMDAIKDNDKLIAKYQEEGDIMKNKLTHTYDATCFHGITDVDKRKLAQQFGGDEE